MTTDLMLESDDVRTGFIKDLTFDYKPVALGRVNK
jgi:hypothetical protein